MPLNHHSWDAGLGALLPGSFERDRDFPLLSVPHFNMQRLDQGKLLLAHAIAQQSLVARRLEEEQQQIGVTKEMTPLESLQEQQQQQHYVATKDMAPQESLEEEQQTQTVETETMPRVSSSLPNDLVNRLVLAETLAQRTVQGTVTEAMKAEEERMGLYLDAGLLGIDLGEIAEKRARGQSEDSIVEEYYEKLKLKSDGKVEPDRKRIKLAAGRTQETDIQDALGAMIRLRTHGANDADTETESDDSD